MKKVVILGCENSHANAFLRFIKEDERYKDVQVVGIYSDETEAMQKLATEFGVPCMQSYDELVGKVDGVIITARHGDNHYKYAKPYISSGVPMFIDKPITVSEEEAIAFAKDLQANGVAVTGGSSCHYEKTVLKLQEQVKNNVYGKTVGGFVKAPLNSKIGYGGFFFYAQHLVEITATIFGHYPKAVKVYQNAENYTVIFRYADYDVTALYAEGCYSYYALRCAQERDEGGVLSIDANCYAAEFATYYQLLCGGAQQTSYKDFVAPVFVMNAIKRAIDSGKEESVKEFEI